LLDIQKYIKDVYIIHVFVRIIIHRNKF